MLFKVRDLLPGEYTLSQTMDGRQKWDLEAQVLKKVADTLSDRDPTLISVEVTVRVYFPVKVEDKKTTPEGP